MKIHTAKGELAKRKVDPKARVNICEICTLKSRYVRRTQIGNLTPKIDPKTKFKT